MKSMAGEMSSAVSAGLPAFGGMAPLPLVTDATSAALPVAMRGAQAALSPNFGAPATPVLWQGTQVFSYTALPSAATATEATPVVTMATRPTAIHFIGNLRSVKTPRAIMQA